MIQGILPVIGGIGVFLVGMVALTEGLRGLAGGALRRFIRRTTVSPLSGAATGAAATALLQSSSATTVAVVGFVGAGLMTFPQALGVIFGANAGTTATGWLVAVLGFKLKLGEIAPALVFAGIVLRLFGRGRLQHAGWAVAGFGLLFVGIAALQSGMAGLADRFDPAMFPDDTLSGRFLLVLIGIAVTIVTQSSSAGVALSLAAIGAGAINFTQAAALVIGMDVGTTFTAALATAGGSVAVRRTGFAHVTFNLMTGVMAFLLLIPLAALVESGRAGPLFADPQIGLVAFHTGFNLIGVAAILGVTRQFSELMKRLIPERGPALTGRLDDRLLAEPAAACDALAATTTEMARISFGIVAARLGGMAAASAEAELAAVGEAIEETRRYADAIHFGAGDAMGARHAAAIHVLDHLARLHGRCRQHERINLLASEARLKPLGADLSGAITAMLGGTGFAPDAASIDRLRRRFRQERHAFRAETIALASTGDIEVDDALRMLDAIRWLHRVSYHLWRILVHLEALGTGGGVPAAAAPGAAGD